MADLAAEHDEEKTVTIDGTYLKAHRSVSSLVVLMVKEIGGFGTKGRA